MAEPPYLNLFVYSDSLAFRRQGQSHDLAFLYPFVLRALIEERIGVRVNLMLRGLPGATIARLGASVVRDTGYFGGTGDALNVAIIQGGIVDCAPHPFTYALAPLLRAIPVLGQRLISFLVKHRRVLQLTWSYREVSESTFSKAYASIVAVLRRTRISPIAVGLPVPTPEVEYRSPGFSASVMRYNELIRQALPEAFCDVESRFTESMRGEFLLEDGHHLTVAGHRLYAEALYPIVEGHVARFGAEARRANTQAGSSG